MKSFYISKKTVDLQDSLYANLNNFSKSNKILSRFCSVPVSVADVALDLFTPPLNAIEQVGMAAINLVGAAFSKQYTLKDALFCTEYALSSVVNIPVKLVFAPAKVIFQLFAIIINPETVQSTNWRKPTFQVARIFNVDQLSNW